MNGHSLSERLRSFASTMPAAWEDQPWGDPVTKVGKKIFAFFGQPGGSDTLTVKLAESHPLALAVSGATPTRYGLGRAGWVTIPLGGPDSLPEEILQDWIDESYRLVASKRLVRELDGRDRSLGLGLGLAVEHDRVIGCS